MLWFILIGSLVQETRDMPHGHSQKELTEGEASSPPKNEQPHLMRSRCEVIQGRSRTACLLRLLATEHIDPIAASVAAVILP